ncbi:hypothetical protein FOMA001_g9765 [Fusarium oxysporum f. sp. matthiolae]|nr:hypothetical protein FOMA001_g9765 [Fusarium oxysporum f. sp. matthiolae]
MSQPTIAQPTHRTPIRQPAPSWYATHLKLDTLLEERKSNRSNQNQELQEMVSRQNTEAIHTHAQSAKHILEQIRLQLTNNAEDISMDFGRLERRVDLILRICKDDQDIRNSRDLEKHYREMADQKIATMTSRRPTSPPPSFPQPQQPKDGAEESEASDSEQEQGGSDAISGGKQKDGEVGSLDTDSVQECRLFGREYHSVCGSDHQGSANNEFILVSPE